MITEFRRHAFLAALICLIIAAIPAISQECIDYADYTGMLFSQIGLPEVPAVYGDVIIDDNFAYISYEDYYSDRGGIMVLNISDPVTPQVVAVVDTIARRGELFITNDLLYLAAGDSGKVYVIDVNEPMQPNILGSLDISRPLTDVLVRGKYAYVTDTIDGVQVIDISDPEHMSILNTVYTTDSAVGLDSSGDYLFVAVYLNKLQILTLEDPTFPVIVGEVEETCSPFGVQILDILAFVADVFCGLKIFDISDALHPSLLGNLGEPVSPFSLDTYGEVLIANVAFSVHVIGVSDPTQPVLLGELDWFGNNILPGDMAITDDLCIVIFGTKILLVKVSDQHFPEFTNWLDLPDSGQKVSVEGNLAAVGCSTNGLFVADVTDPSAPVTLATYPMADTVRDVVLADELAYLAVQDAGLQIVDLSQPDMPSVIGTLATGHQARGLKLQDSKVYIADGDAGLTVVDVSVPTSPALLGSVATGSYSYNVAVAGEHAYLANRDGLWIIDLTDLLVPPVGYVATANPIYSVAISDSHAFVTARQSGLQVIDISNPNAPTIVTTIATINEPFDLFIQDKILYAAVRTSGLQIFDITDPTSPVCVGMRGLPTETDDSLVYSARGVTQSDDHIYIVGRDSGLLITPQQCHTATPCWLTSFTARPNERQEIIVRWAVSSDDIRREFELAGRQGNMERILLHHQVATGSYEAVDISPWNNDLAVVYTLRMFDLDQQWLTLGTISVPPIEQPKKVQLHTAKPNPFNPMTTINFDHPRRGLVRLQIFDLSGRLIRTLVHDEVLAAGSYSFSWYANDNKGRSVASGTYICRLETPDEILVKRLSLVR